MHIYDPARFPMPPSQRVAPTNAAVAQYRLLQQRTGTTRVIVVQPRNYAIDNRVTVDAIKQLAPNARGVAVLHPTVTDAELKALNDAGIRGIRFSLGDPATAAVTPDMVEPLARRVADLGWHVQFNVEGEQIVALADVLRRLPTPMVFDHLANPGPDGHRSPVSRDRPQSDRPRPHLGEAFRRLFQQQGRAAISGRDAYRAGVRASCTRTARLGQRLAASGRGRSCR